MERSGNRDWGASHDGKTKSSTIFFHLKWHCLNISCCLWRKQIEEPLPTLFFLINSCSYTADRQLFSLPVDPWRPFSSFTALATWYQTACICQTNMTHSEWGPHQRVGAPDHQRERGQSPGGNTGVHLFLYASEKRAGFCHLQREPGKACQAVIDLWQDRRCLPPLLAHVNAHYRTEKLYLLNITELKELWLTSSQSWCVYANRL